MTIRAVTMNHDFVQPLRAGDVAQDGMKIVLDTTTPIQQAWSDLEIDVFEIGLFNYACSCASDAATDGHPREIVAIPFFIRRAFAHRHVYVSSESPMTELADIAGARVGINMWFGSGNFWTRDALRDAGVDVEAIRWVVAPLRPGGAIPDEVVPDYVEQDRRAAASLIGMLADGEIDAFVFPAAPAETFGDGSIVHLLRDFDEVERRYFERTRIFPGQHVLAIRKPLVENEPALVRIVFDAFEASRTMWEQQRRFMAETSPWLLRDLELSARLMGADWQPNGVAKNEAMLRRLCEGITEEGLVDRPLRSQDLFADFERFLAKG
jgi:4,5-dihydroxyphthalate decarboxylase